MNDKGETRRRWLGTIFLAFAIAMLIAGQTVLQSSLQGIPYILFWFGCFGFTSLAMLMAFLDLSAVRRRTRDEHHELLHRAVEDIAREHQVRQRKDTNSPNSSP